MTPPPPRDDPIYVLSRGSATRREAVEQRLRHVALLPPTARELAVTAWVTVWDSSPYDQLDDMPYSAHAPHYSLINHTEEVTDIGLHLAGYARERWGVSVPTDSLLTTLILHDLDKALLYHRSLDGSVTIEPRAAAIGHGRLGAAILTELGFDSEVVSIVASHSPTNPDFSPTALAWILHYADLFAADHVFRTTPNALAFYQRPHLPHQPERSHTTRAPR